MVKVEGLVPVNSDRKEVFISVDVETAGPIPGEFSLLSIGACLVYDTSTTFECQLKPISDYADPKALEVSGLSLETLCRTGVEPVQAMTQFTDWIGDATGPDADPVFVGFNAPFDWSFVNYYLHRFTGVNPFGFTALDIKALWMGISGCSWADTRSSSMAKRLQPTTRGNHDALHDAQYQAELFRRALALREAAGTER